MYRSNRLSLHNFAGGKAVVDTVECLLDAGANLNARTIWGDTAAHYAALEGTFEVLQIFV